MLTRSASIAEKRRLAVPAQATPASAAPPPAPPAQPPARVGGAHPLDRRVVEEARAAPRASDGEASREQVDVAGRIGRGVEAAVEITVDRRLDRLDLGVADRVALEPARLQQRVDVARMLEAGAIAVDVQDAAPLEIERDALPLGHRKERAPRRQRKPDGGDRVAAIMRYLRRKLGEPRIFGA